MLLLIPSIEIKNGECVYTVRRSDGTLYSKDPFERAKLWRIENAKSLHITDVDGAIEGRPVNLDVIREIVKIVDIPIEIGGGMRTPDDVRRAFDAGVFRVTIGTMLIEDPDAAQKVLAEFSSSFVSIGIDAQNGITKILGRTVGTGLTAASVALNAKQLGFRRVIYKDVFEEGERRVPNFAAIRTLAETIGMRVTASGGVSTVEDLLKLQEMESIGVDSVIVGRSLLENRFSCQAIWRTSEENKYPYTAKV